MRVLIAYPNLPLMLSPAISVGLFTAICRKENVEVDLFETATYSDDNETGMLLKTKLGSGRAYSLGDLQLEIKPTNQVLSDWEERVKTFKPDLILFSAVEDTFKDVILMINHIEHLNIPHILGGVWPINAPEKAIGHPSVQAICRFEGELVVRDAIRAMKAGKNISSVSGLWTKTKRNPPQPLVDIESVIPDFSLYDPKRFNRAIGGRIVRSMNIETYRGCPYSCTFCNSPMTRHMDKNYLRRKSIPTIKKELEHYIETYGIDYFFFIDDTWLARPRKEVIELCDVLEKFGIPWWCNTRIETVTEELLFHMKRAGCDRIQFGIESGNEKYRAQILERYATNEEYYSKIDIINNSGIPYGLNVIIGMPHETRDHIRQTAEMVHKFKGYDGLSVSIFIPYHGTKLRDYAVAHGLMDSDWISSDGLLVGGSVLNQPEPYLSKEEIEEIAHVFKYMCFWPNQTWPENYEKKYYDMFFASDTALSGSENIKKRWGCEASEYVRF